MSARKLMLVVAAHANDADDCRLLLDMLGMTPPRQKRKPGRPSVDHGHGDRRTYQKGCRCAACREAFRLYAASLRAKWKSDPTSADRAGHGKPSTYKNHGCRCELCSKANSADVAAFRRRKRRAAALAETGGVR
ncbi:MAG: hypothetical protein HOQ47_09475 [Streptomyces sp.]|nr:hypothetical protein [Streptomyces sp.]